MRLPRWFRSAADRLFSRACCVAPDTIATEFLDAVRRLAQFAGHAFDHGAKVDQLVREPLLAHLGLGDDPLLVVGEGRRGVANQYTLQRREFLALPSGRAPSAPCARIGVQDEGRGRKQRAHVRAQPEQGRRRLAIAFRMDFAEPGANDFAIMPDQKRRNFRRMLPIDTPDALRRANSRHEGPNPLVYEVESRSNTGQRASGHLLIKAVERIALLVLEVLCGHGHQFGSSSRRAECAPGMVNRPLTFSR